MKLHILFLSLLHLGCAALSWAAPIDSAQARRLALDFLASQSQKRSISAQSCSKAIQRFSRAEMYTTNGAFMLHTGDEFILVSRDDASPTILGYKLKSTDEPAARIPSVLQPQAMPEALRSLLTSPHASICTASPYAEGLWHAVAPLLTTTRQQGAPYNALCPLYRHSNGEYYDTPCLVGCVATAMEQVITYHRPVITLLDTLHGWSTDHIEVPDVLPSATLDTHLILDDYDTQPYTAQQADAVARLSLWLGLACHMQWGIASSGAYSQDLVRPLRHTFGFPYVHYLEKRKYDPAAYWQCLSREIMAGRPVYYAGAIMGTGGHAFVLDGLDDEGFFHVNWGYGGDFDGYFRLDILSYAQPEADRRAGEEVTDGFLADQEAILVSTTPVEDAMLPDTLTRTPTDIVLESMEVMQPPLTDNYTTVRLKVKNPSSTQPLNNTFALLENLPSNTSLISQAKCIALTAAYIAPQESKVLEVHAQFTRTGTVLLSLTHDGEHLLGQQTVSVTAGTQPTFLTDTPVLSFPDSRTLQVSQHIANGSPSSRASQTFLYDLLDNYTGTSCRTTHYIYIGADSSLTDTLTFRSLIPGRAYTLRLRQRWPIVQSVDFTMPEASAIVSPVSHESACGLQTPSAWYTTDGRCLSSRPHSPGIYILRQGGQSQKVVVKRE